MNVSVYLSGKLSAKVITTLDRTRDRFDRRLQYPSHVLTVKYCRQKPAISSSCGIDPFSKDIVEPT